VTAPVEHPGGYAFVPGILPYSAGVRATAGHEIVHATLHRSVPWQAGFDVVADHLAGLGRPRQALCSIELRAPEPFSFEGFGRFNAGYRAVLEEWDLVVDDLNPVARTNVAPVVGAPAEVSLHAFGYTVPAPSADTGPTFVVSGAGDLVDQSDLRAEAIVRPGDMSDDAWRERMAGVVDRMAARMDALGVGWDDVTDIDVYTVGPLDRHVESSILRAAGPAAVHGIHWYLAHPPVRGLTFEMDVRGVATEIRI
jgi:hypothetical protein